MRSFWFFIGLAVAALPCAASDTAQVLWQRPETTTARDWIWGPGGEARTPKAPFEFIEEDRSGTNPKIRVRDSKGDQWIVKFGGENHSEVFASRLLFALGYVAQPSYFVKAGVIIGSHDLRRAKPFVAKDGSFVYARFKLRDHKRFVHADGHEWSWNDNPFIGSHELNGLKILLMLTSNWDAKDARDGKGSNTSVYSKPGSADQLYYAFDDWGATMGKWGGFLQRDKWDPAGFREQTRAFVRLAPTQAIERGYRGKHGKDITSGISADDIRWLLTYLAGVTDEDLRAGLQASAGIDVLDSNPVFAVTHEKSMVIDDTIALIGSLNWEPENFEKTRDYAVITTDAKDVREVIDCFEADWSRQPFEPRRSSNLIWCPGAGRETIAQFIDSAEHSLFVQNERYQDVIIVEHMVRAKLRGVKVHVMARPSHSLRAEQLVEGIGDLRIMQDVGIGVHKIKHFKLHAKMLLADKSRAIIGSINLSPASFDKRRELAIRLKKSDTLDRLLKIVHQDWEESHPIDLSDEGLLSDLQRHPKFGGLSRMSSMLQSEP